MKETEGRMTESTHSIRDIPDEDLTSEQKRRRYRRAIHRKERMGRNRGVFLSELRSAQAELERIQKKFDDACAAEADAERERDQAETIYLQDLRERLRNEDDDD